MTVGERLKAAVARMVDNYTVANDAAIEDFLRNADTWVVEKMVDAIEKNFTTPIVKGPVDQFFKNSAGDFEADLDEATLGGFKKLQDALNGVATAGGF